MKPFTSKHCAQYLTKESPLNQTKDLASKYPSLITEEFVKNKNNKDVAQQIPAKKNKLKEQYREKPGPTGIAPDKRTFKTKKHKK